jgi:uncharacterized protein YbbC (DUF1343 family)
MKPVLSGLDRWIAEGPSACALNSGARLGLLAHPASIDRQARHVIDWLTGHRDYDLVALFAPEHGLWGCEQDMESVANSRDPRSGLQVVSLYGTDRASLRPDPAVLERLDAIIVDLQDIGSRYYTFIYTMAFVMQAAGEAGTRVIVLDRPNPIGGNTIEGPVLEPTLSSFVGEYPLPVRHGMTIGELAQIFRGEFGIDCDLHVVEMQGWRRSMGFHATGLPWVPPSPNMPSPNTAIVYPGGCLIEGTSLSEGRGTTLPFELIGAPWLDAHALAEQMTAETLPGVLFRPANFRPIFQKHAETTCHGVQVIVTDVVAFRPFRTYLALIRAARQADSRFDWRSETYEFESKRPAIDYLLGVDGLRQAIESSTPLVEIEHGWQDALTAFSALRDRYLLYP